MNDGIVIILKRMETHPEEFYDDGGKWKFLYKEYFRDVMTEEEKAALHTKLKDVRRSELTSKVMKTLVAEPITRDEWEQREKAAFYDAPVRREGDKISYFKTMTGKGNEITEASDGRIYINGVLVK